MTDHQKKPDDDIVNFEPLSEQEQNVLVLLAKRFSNKEIAQKLYLSVNTVKWYNQQLFSKLGVSSLWQAVETARRQGLLQAASHSPEKRWHNLPADVTPFIGRQAELAELCDLLQTEDRRLITIVGPGGMGKSRLAIAMARRFTSANFPDGTYFVPLAGLSDPAQIFAAIAEATGYQFQEDQRTPELQIRDFLRDKQMLLILDNFEHLKDGVPLVIDLLEVASRLSIVITSRERLNLSNDLVYPLRGLSYSPNSQIADVQDYEATQLFVDSAQRQNSHFNPGEEELGLVAQICQLVEGMPLAIILAASWIEVLSLDEISMELRQSLDILAVDMQDLPSRQRSIRAVIDHAWNLLDGKAQDVLMRFSVFRGGATREAVAAVTGGRLTTLAGLVDRAMLRRNMSNGRFEVHELVRQFAAEKLEASGDTEDAYNAHSAYYAALLERQIAALKGPGQRMAQEIIRTEIDNVRLMWDWATERGRYDDLDRAIEALDRFYEVHDRYHEARDLFGELVDVLRARGISAPPKLLGKALVRKGKAHELLGEFGIADESLAEGMELIRQTGDRQEAALATCYRGQNAWRMRYNELALSLAEEAISEFEALGDRWGIAYALQVKGYALNRQFLVDEAIGTFQECRRIQHEIGDRVGEGFSNYYLGEIIKMDGRFAEASTYLEKARQIFLEIDNRRGIALTLESIGWLKAYVGDYDEARALFEEFLSLSKEIGYQERIAAGMDALAFLSWYLDDYNRAEQGFKDLLDMSLRAGLFSDYLMEAYIGLAQVMISQERFEQAEAYARQALALETDFNRGMLHMILGEVACAMGDVMAGRIHFRDAALLTTGLPKIWKIRFLARLPRLLVAEGKRVQAVELLAFVLNSESLVYESRRKAVVMLAELEAELQVETFQVAVEQGEALDFHEVIAEFLNDSER